MTWPTLPTPAFVVGPPAEGTWALGELPQAPPADLVESLSNEATQDPDITSVKELVPVPEGTFELSVMAGQGDYGLAVGAYLWAPLTITQIDYDMHYLNRTRRV